MSVTASGGAAAGSQRGRCRPPRWCGASRSPGGAIIAAWRAPPRTRCSQAVERRRDAGVAASRRSSWPAGRPRRSAPDCHVTVAKALVLGAVAADRPPRRRPSQRPAASRCSSTGSWSRRIAGSNGAARPTTATTRRRRWRSSCAPQRGAAAGPDELGPARRRADRRPAGDQRPAPAAFRPRRRRARRPSRRRIVSTPPAGGRSTSATRPIAPSKGSSPPAPNTTDRPAVAAPTAPAHLHGHAAPVRPRRGRRMSPNARTLTPPGVAIVAHSATTGPVSGPIPPRRRR